MPSTIGRQPDKSDNDYQAERKREFDRWRDAVDIVQRLREAGFDCELGDSFPSNRH